MTDSLVELQWIEGEYAVAALGHNALIPPWVINTSGLSAIVRTHDETSVVAPTSMMPDDVQAERGFIAFRVRGRLDFGMVGLISRITGALSAAGISVFVISTFDTDYVMVWKVDRDLVEAALAGVAQFV